MILRGGIIIQKRENLGARSQLGGRGKQAKMSEIDLRGGVSIFQISLKFKKV